MILQRAKVWSSHTTREEPTRLYRRQQLFGGGDVGSEAEGAGEMGEAEALASGGVSCLGRALQPLARGLVALLGQIAHAGQVGRLARAALPVARRRLKVASSLADEKRDFVRTKAPPKPKREQREEKGTVSLSSSTPKPA